MSTWGSSYQAMTSGASSKRNFPKHLRNKRPRPRQNSQPKPLELRSVKPEVSDLGRCRFVGLVQSEVTAV